MSHTFSPLARRLARWSIPTVLAVLAGCGGGGGAAAPDTLAQADALRGAPQSCTGPGFTAQAPFTVSAMAAGSRQQVLFTGPLDTGGFAIAWSSKAPLDPLLSPRVWWQRFDAAGQGVQPAFELRYAEDVASTQDVAVLVMPQGRVVVAYAVTRGVDPFQPTLVANSILVRIFQDGEPVGSEITVAQQVVDLRSRPARYVHPLLAAAPDGSLLVGWHLAGMVKPELLVQQVTAAGTNVGDVVRIDAFDPPASQLVALASGGWIALTPWYTAAPEYRPIMLVTQVGTGRALDLPAELPRGSYLLHDARGMLVASGPSQDGPASLQQFNAGGHAAGQPTPLAGTPVGAVSMADGGAAILMDVGGTVSLQRVDPRGDLAGQPLATSVPTGALAGAVSGVGLVLAWARDTLADSTVFGQLFTSSCTH